MKTWQALVLGATLGFVFGCLIGFAGSTLIGNLLSPARAPREEAAPTTQSLPSQPQPSVSPSPASTDETAQEAVAVFRQHLEANVIECGDSWFWRHLEGSTIVQLKFLEPPAYTVNEHSISAADRANGLEWKGDVFLAAEMIQRHYREDGGWTQWRDKPYITWLMEKRHGEWNEVRVGIGGLLFVAFIVFGLFCILLRRLGVFLVFRLVFGLLIASGFAVSSLEIRNYPDS